jgi:phosphatidate cytidylyltransferase
MKQRLITGIITGIIFLTMLFIGNYAYLILILLLASIGFREYVQLNHMPVLSFSSIVGFIIVAILTLPWGKLIFTYETNFYMLLWLVTLLWLTNTVISKNKMTLDHVSLLLLGVVYISTGFRYMLDIRYIDSHGLFWSLLIFVCIWVTDSAAYFVGSRFGKHKLWPDISPKKSIEGAIGGILFSILVAVVFYCIEPQLLPLQHAILIGFLIAIIGHIGDLIQSAIKRTRGIKDSGNIFPGHGGVLDRVDSWLIVFPCMFVYGHYFGLFTS